MKKQTKKKNRVLVEGNVKHVRIRFVIKRKDAIPPWRP